MKKAKKILITIRGGNPVRDNTICRTILCSEDEEPEIEHRIVHYRDSATFMRLFNNGTNRSVKKSSRKTFLILADNLKKAEVVEVMFIDISNELQKEVTPNNDVSSFIIKELSYLKN